MPVANSNINIYKKSFQNIVFDSVFVMFPVKHTVIHPASRGVAAHTAGLFRSVRGAKGGFPPWGLFK